MGNFLIKFFIKDYENVTDPEVRARYGRFAGVVGLITNIVLSAMKMVFGLLLNSIAIIADGVHSLIDASSAIITLIGFKLAAMPQDKKHPYGHARIEYLTGLFIAVLIIVLGLELVKTSFEKILHPEPVAFSYPTIAMLAVAILIASWLSFFNKRIGKKINSVALKVVGADNRNDVFVTAGVLIGLLAEKFLHVHLDGYMGCLVALLIIWSAIHLLMQTISPLLGEAPDEALVRAITDHVLSHKNILGVHDLVVHNYGPGKIFASAHIEVDAKGDLLESHDVIDNIERSIVQDLHIQFTAHMDPIELNNPVVDRANQVVADALAPMEGVAGFHDLRAVPGPTHTNIIFDAVLSPGCKMEEDEIKAIIEARLKEINPSYFVVITFDRAYTKL